MLLTKIQAGYSSALPSSMNAGVGCGIRCDSCSFYRSSLTGVGACSVVSGEIDPAAACNLWSTNGHVDLHFLDGREAKDILYGSNEGSFLGKVVSGPEHWLARLSKKEGGYICNVPVNIRPKVKGVGFRCQTCTYHRPLGECHLVKGGVADNGCCNLYSAPGETASFDYASGAEIKTILPTSSLQDIEDLCIT